MKNPRFQFSALCVLILLIDQLSKAWALTHCAKPLVCIPHFFNLTLVLNSGSIWGIGAHTTQWLAWVGVLVIGFVFFKIKSIQNLSNLIALSCLAGGIAGNTYDRLFRGAVVDFLDFYVKTWHWPCFNVADIAIVCSCFYFIFKASKKDATL